LLATLLCSYYTGRAESEIAFVRANGFGSGGFWGNLHHVSFPFAAVITIFVIGAFLQERLKVPATVLRFGVAAMIFLIGWFGPFPV